MKIVVIYFIKETLFHMKITVIYFIKETLFHMKITVIYFFVNLVNEPIMVIRDLLMLY